MRRKKRKYAERWGRKEDKKVFEELIQVVIKTGLSLTEFFKAGKDDAQETILNTLMRKYEWKRGIRSFKSRLASLCKTSFSVREKKLLRKLCRKQTMNHSEVDFRTILPHFPGKSIQMLENKFKEGFADILH